MKQWERQADATRVTAAAMTGYGQWLADLAPWRYFVTLTHRAPNSTAPSYTPYTRVGLNRHNRMVRDWFYQSVRPLDITARLWGETETHVAGGFHEHALLAVNPTMGIYAAMAAWYDRTEGGLWNVRRFDSDRAVELAGAYIEKAAKYAGKAAAQPPKVYGLGLDTAPNFLHIPRI